MINDYYDTVNTIIALEVNIVSKSNNIREWFFCPRILPGEDSRLSRESSPVTWCDFDCEIWPNAAMENPRISFLISPALDMPIFAAKITPDDGGGFAAEPRIANPPRGGFADRKTTLLVMLINNNSGYSYFKTAKMIRTTDKQ